MQMRKNQAKLAELKKKRHAPPTVAAIPKKENDQLSLRNAIKRIQVALKTDWYYPIGEFELSGEVVTDFREVAKELLGHVAEAGNKDRIIELAMTVPRLRTAGDLEKQLDRNVMNWRQLDDQSLCYLYGQAIKNLDEAIYVPLGLYLGFFHGEKKKGTTRKNISHLKRDPYVPDYLKEEKERNEAFELAVQKLEKLGIAERMIKEARSWQAKAETNEYCRKIFFPAKRDRVIALECV